MKDYEGQIFSFLSIVCDGTTFHVVALVRADGGTPSSSKCLAKFTSAWVSWAGYPVILACDRGLHNYGSFSKGLSNNGVYQRVAGVEAAEQIGRGERHGGIFKTNMYAVINAHQVTGKKQMKMAAAVCISGKNEMCRNWENGYCQYGSKVSLTNALFMLYYYELI